MPNLNGKKVNEIHESIINIGGSNNGVTSDSLPICDGKGTNTGIYVSSTKTDIDARRGILKNSYQKGGISYKCKIDNAFPNSPSSMSVSNTQSKLVLDLDMYSHFKINFTRDDFIPKIYIKSNYFDQSTDGDDEIVGFWQRTYAGIEKYFVDSENYVDPIFELDENLYILDPNPNAIQPFTDVFYNYGFIKRRFISYQGIRHNPAVLEFHMILSANADSIINIPIRSSSNTGTQTSEYWFKYRPTDGPGNPYTSASIGLEYVPNGLNVKAVNFDNMIVDNSISVYKVVIPNPTLYFLPNYASFIDSTACANYGEEIFPNVDLRFYSTFLRGGNVDSSTEVLVYKLT